MRALDPVVHGARSTGLDAGHVHVPLAGDDGGATFVPLTVLDDRQADVLVVSAITTWNAYNTYGGASLYDGDGGRSKVVTFDRPYHASGSGHFFGGEYELVQLVESMGLDVAYTTNIDLHARPEQIEAGGYKVVVTPGPRRVLLGADPPEPRGGPRPRASTCMFLGANAGFRRIRLEPSEHGPHRLEVNYRVAQEDPLYGTGDQELVTAEWRAAPAAAPEASLIGNYYESNPVQGRHGGRRPRLLDLRRHRAAPPATASPTWCRTSTTG